MTDCTNCNCTEDERAFCAALALCRDFYLGPKATAEEVIKYVVFHNANGIMALAKQAAELAADTDGMTRQ